MRLGYFPGCALHGSSNDYEQSLCACLTALEVELAELDDWICCGATSAHSLNHKLALALPARNLALAGRQGHAELFVPCPMCSMQLLRVSGAIEADEQLRTELASIVEADLSGSTTVLNLIQLFERIGLDRLKSAVKQPLKDLKPACYYGCLLVRPPAAVKFDDAEQPRSMEAVVMATGAKPVDWNYRTECCGAGMTMADTETVLELTSRILKNAVEHGANCIVTACPMCHVNLDMKQAAAAAFAGATFHLPIYYLSDLVGMSLGLSASELGTDRHFVLAAKEA
jgi:heterodisulfide reductase subunit B